VRSTGLFLLLGVLGCASSSSKALVVAKLCHSSETTARRYQKTAKSEAEKEWWGLVKALSSEKWWRRQQACRKLWQLALRSEKLRLFLEKIHAQKHLHPEARNAIEVILLALKFRITPQLCDRFPTLLTLAWFVEEGDEEAREEAANRAAKLLATIKTDEALRCIVWFCIRSHLAYEARRICLGYGEKALRFLKKPIKSSDRLVRFGAFVLASSFKTESAMRLVAPLLHLPADDILSLRVHVADAIQRMLENRTPPEWLIAELLRALKEIESHGKTDKFSGDVWEKHMFGRKVAEILGSAGERVVAHLAAIVLNDSLSSWTRRFAAVALGITRSKPALAFLTSLLKSSKTKVRRWALWGLAEFKNSVVEPYLLDVLRKEKDAECRRIAIIALADCGTEKAIPLLKALYKKATGELRELVVYSWSQIEIRLNLPPSERE